uniref:Uncharacterized protein n=1 Tax=Phenylobacterium glaciei TaxID=2803784 RepID=A0A974S852_9CAUL|nr:hypothetical protein JKL49_20515 [Phenylobacterium glaciei]
MRDNLSLILTAESGYVGRSRLTFDPALSPEMGGYIASKLSVQLKGPDWRVAAFVSNPNNTQGDTFAYGNPSVSARSARSPAASPNPQPAPFAHILTRPLRVRIMASSCLGRSINRRISFAGGEEGS